MWKMLVGFIVFAAIVVFVLMKSDADIDMSGEKHGIDAGESHDAAPTVVPPTPVAPVASEEASAPATIASAASQ